MHETRVQSRENLTDFLSQRCVQFLAERASHHLKTGFPRNTSTDIYPEAAYPVEKGDDCRKDSLHCAIKNFFEVILEPLEKGGWRQDSKSRLACWIAETKRDGLTLPEVIQSLLELKEFILRSVNDRLFYRPIEANKRYQEITGIFDQTLVRLSSALNEASRNPCVAGPVILETQPPEAPSESFRLLTTISHELHAPLVSIIGDTEGIIDVLDDFPNDRIKGLRENAKRILSNTRHLLSVVRNTVEWSKHENQAMTLEARGFDLRKCVIDVLTTVSPMLKEKGIQAVLRSPESIPRPFGDYRRTMQILLNLLTNAIRYTPPQGRIAIEVSPLSGRDQDGEACRTRFVKVTVIDTGIGIDKEKTPLILDEFGKCEEEDHSDGEGLGVELYIAKRLVELQGGQIWSKSQPRKGSRFSFTLPIEKPGSNGPNQEIPTHVVGTNITEECHQAL